MIEAELGEPVEIVERRVVLAKANERVRQAAADEMTGDVLLEG